TLSSEGAHYYALSSDGVNYSEWFSVDDESSMTKDWYLSGSDGEKVIYLKSKDIFGNISLENPSAHILLNTQHIDQTIKRITEGETGIYDIRPQFSSDGSEVIFVSNREGQKGLWKVSSAGMEQPINLIADSSYASGAILSADESSLVYYQMNDGFTCYLQSPIGDFESRQELTGPDFVSSSDPCFNADGSKVYFLGNKVGQVDIWEKDLASSTFTQITNNPKSEESISLSSNNQLVFERDDFIYRLDLATGVEEHLISGQNPHINADGTNVVFEKQGQIYLWVGDGYLQMTQRGTNTSPVISSDGSKIAFVSNRDGGLRIWVKELSDPTFTINNGDSSTTNPQVTLSLNAPGAVKMAFSLDGIVYSAWEPYQSEKQVELRHLEGEQTIYVKFMDAEGKVTLPILASILLDLAPQNVLLTINHNEVYTHDPNVTLQIMGDGISRVAFSEDGVSWSLYENYQKEMAYTLQNSSVGKKTIYVKAEDENHQESDPAFDTIILTNNVSVKNLKTIYNQDGSVRLQAKAVSLSSTVAGAEYFIDTLGAAGTGVAMTALDGLFDSAEEDVAVTLSGLDPALEKTVYLQGKDIDDNWSGAVSHSLNPSAETLLKLVAENYKQIKDMQGECAVRTYWDDTLESEGTGLTMKKIIPDKIRIEDPVSNLIIIKNATHSLLENSVTGSRRILPVDPGKEQYQGFHYQIEGFVDEHDLEITILPSDLGDHKWEITATPKQEELRTYKSLLIQIDTEKRVVEKVTYDVGIEGISNPIVEYQNFQLIGGIYHPLKIVSSKTYGTGQEAETLKEELEWTTIELNTGLDETLFEINVEE
ncbi:hypothetical protein ACFLQ1_01825, partial [Candidatus Auribacterota bacterium]